MVSFFHPYKNTTAPQLVPFSKHYIIMHYAFVHNLHKHFCIVISQKVFYKYLFAKPSVGVMLRILFQTTNEK